MNANRWAGFFLLFAVFILLLTCIHWEWTVKASQRVQPVQIYGCSVSSRDLAVYESERENIKKGFRKPADLETLDQIAAASNGDGLHACRLFDPESKKRYMVVFYSPYNSGSSVAIVEASH